LAVCVFLIGAFGFVVYSKMTKPRQPGDHFLGSSGDSDSIQPTKNNRHQKDPFDDSVSNARKDDFAPGSGTGDEHRSSIAQYNQDEPEFPDVYQQSEPRPGAAARQTAALAGDSQDRRTENPFSSATESRSGVQMADSGDGELQQQHESEFGNARSGSHNPWATQRQREPVESEATQQQGVFAEKADDVADPFRQNSAQQTRTLRYVQQTAAGDPNSLTNPRQVGNADEAVAPAELSGGTTAQSPNDAGSRLSNSESALSSAGDDELDEYADESSLSHFEQDDSQRRHHQAAQSRPGQAGVANANRSDFDRGRRSVWDQTSPLQDTVRTRSSATSSTRVRSPDAGRDPGDTDSGAAQQAYGIFSNTTGSAGSTESSFAGISSSQLSNQPSVYVVQTGDNFWSISKKLYGTGRYYLALAHFNRGRISDPGKVRSGMKVLIPTREVLETRYRDLFPQRSVSVGAAGESSGATRSPGLFMTSDGRAFYRVGRNDTLTGIAKNHLGRASRWEQIYSLNRDRIADPARLKIGTTLRMPADVSRVQLVRNPRGVR